jgi:glycerol kinase
MFGTLLSAALLSPRSVYSHDGWVEVSPNIVEKNQSATIALLQGNHSNEHKSYRIAGKWDQKYTTLVVSIRTVNNIL